jgi:hypothetical protein
MAGEGPVVASTLAIEPQFRALSLPLFVGIRYASIRNARFEVDGVTVRRGILDYSGVFVGFGVRIGAAANKRLQRPVAG